MSHRAYPPPARPWAMFMRWHDLLFAHWRIEAARLRPYIPPGLEIDEYDGSAWLGVVPFRMSGIRHRCTPPVPGLSAFPELNVRTYVRPAGDDTCPGVWFFSLDAASRIAVRVARATFGLAYMDAGMRCAPDGQAVVYESLRRGPIRDLAYGPTQSTSARFLARYGPDGPPSAAPPGSLESFLTDRYGLYAWRRTRLIRADIDHAPWPLQPAHAEIATNTMGQQIGIAALAAPPLLHFARELDVVAWLPRVV